MHSAVHHKGPPPLPDNVSQILQYFEYCSDLAVHLTTKYCIHASQPSNNAFDRTFPNEVVIQWIFHIISLIKIRSIDTLTKIATQGDPSVAILMSGPKDIHVYSQVIPMAHGPLSDRSFPYYDNC